ncbi:MAG: ParB/RepB/Spo0J family partition protein [Spirulinaceae cyanobacterium]
MAKKEKNLGKFFVGALQAQQEEVAIDSLREEIESLKSQGQTAEAEITQLRQQLSQQQGVIKVPVEEIQANKEQPRQSFSQESISSMARTLAEDGQLQPIILITHNQGYLLFDGERRWRAAQQLGWESLSAITIPVISPEAWHRQALLTSLHREDLNPLDKAEAIIKEICVTTQIKQQEIPKILASTLKHLQRKKLSQKLGQLLTLSLEEQQQELEQFGLDEEATEILTVLVDLQLNPTSVSKNIFPMLNLFADLKGAIREEGLLGSVALILNRLSPQNLDTTASSATRTRKKVTKQVLEQQLSVAKTRELVKGLIAQKQPLGEVKVNLSKVVQSLNSLTASTISQASSEDLDKLRELLKQKLGEVEKAQE